MIRNPYIDFINLIPRQAKWIGTVTKKRTDGYAEVQKLNTGAVSTLCVCSGDVQVGKKVLVQGATVVTVLSDSQSPVVHQLD